MRVRLRFVGFLLIALAIAGCGAGQGTGAAGASATITPQPTPYPTGDMSTPTGTPGSGSTFSPCDLNLFASATRMGDLLVTNGAYSHLGYPRFQVPDNTPLKPLKINENSGAPFGRQADTNPFLTRGGGFELDVCNASTSRSHVVGNVVATLRAFTGYSGKLNQWGPCDGAYDNVTGQSSGGCGGGGVWDYYQLAQFAPSAGVGATVTTTSMSNANQPPPYQHTPLPVTLAPNQMVTINIALQPPTAPGTYTFAFGITVDGAAASYSVAAPAILLASVAQQWSGKACTAPAMKSQIPTSPEATYICPNS